MNILYDDMYFQSSTNLITKYETKHVLYAHFTMNILYDYIYLWYCVFDNRIRENLNLKLKHVALEITKLNYFQVDTYYKH